MKILIVSSERISSENTLPSKFELDQAKSLIKLGHEVQLVCVDFKLEWSTKSNIKWKSYLRKIISPLYGSTTFKYKYQIIEGVNTFNVSINFVGDMSNMYEDDIWDVLVRDMTGKGGVIFNADLIHGHSRFLRGIFLARKFANILCLPLVCTEHSSKILYGSFTNNERNIYKSIVNGADEIICVSTYLAKSVEELTGRTPKIVPNMLAEEFLCTPVKAKNDEFVLLSVGNMVKVKRQRLFLDVVKEVVDKNDFAIKGIIVGEGPLRDELIDALENLELEDIVEVKNFMGVNELVSLMDQCTVLLITSKWETFGVVGVEAMSRGKYVISTPCGGPSDYLVSEVLGRIVNDDSCEVIAEEVVNYLSQSDKRRKKERMEFAANRYSSAVVGESLIELYKRHIS